MDGPKLPPGSQPTGKWAWTAAKLKKIKDKAPWPRGQNRTVEARDVSKNQLKQVADRGVPKDSRTMSQFEVRALEQEAVLNAHDYLLIESKDAVEELLRQVRQLRGKVYCIVEPYHKQLSWLKEETDFDPVEWEQLRRKFVTGVERAAGKLQRVEEELKTRVKRKVPVDVAQTEKLAREAVTRFKDELAEFKKEYYAKTEHGASVKKAPIDAPEVLTPAKHKEKLQTYISAIENLSEGLNQEDGRAALIEELARIAGEIEVEVSLLLNSYDVFSDTDAKFITQTLQVVEDYKVQFDNLKDEITQGEAQPVAMSEILKTTAAELIKGLETMLDWEPGKKVDAPLEVTHVPDPSKNQKEYLPASSLKSPELRHKLELYYAASENTDKAEALKSLTQLVAEKQQLYNKLQPLLGIAASKSLYMDSEPPESVSRSLNALTKLAFAAKEIGYEEATHAFLDALVGADEAITELEQFDQSVSPDLYHHLTRALPGDPSTFDHLQNLISRMLLDQSQGRLTEKNLEKLELLYKYHDEVVQQTLKGGNELAAGQAYLGVVTDIFGTTESVRALAHMTKSLEELRALGSALQDWQSSGVEQLRQFCKLLESVRRDLALPQVEDALEGITALRREFSSAAEANGKQEASQRLDVFNHRLKEGIESYALDRIKHQKWREVFKSQADFCASLQTELNTQLAGVAEVVVEHSKEGIAIHVRTLLKTPEDAATHTGQLMNRKDNLSKALVTSVQSNPPKDLLVQDENSKQYEWAPHSQDMLKNGVDYFVGRYDSFQKGLERARENSKRIRLAASARAKVDQTAGPLQLAVESYQPQQKNAYSLPSGLDKLTGLPLAEIPHNVVSARNGMARSLMAGDLSVAQAQKLLPPLLEVGEHASNRQMSSEKVLKKGASLAMEEPVLKELEKYSKKLRPKWLYRLTGSKRLKALEATRNVITVCQQCAKAQGMTSAMLEGLTLDMEMKGLRYSELANALSYYKKQFDSAFFDQPIHLPPVFSRDG